MGKAVGCAAGGALGGGVLGLIDREFINAQK